MPGSNIAISQGEEEQRRCKSLTMLLKQFNILAAEICVSTSGR